ncbi:FAD dependent oxidoreductase [Mytilinidion resinicola]|uniref:FAD dependent oxidoreductase n=1 Tax=Mytilinidion resinicola TaxID=574789 RepID=A0A6A6YKL2_9PEZI|nr:FAD dependent oxidoreductase [Mytilinidion resinicola]KAF2809093.1 FAD dependent oxidoreductase [Mytilinidion resinicola]
MSDDLKPTVILGGGIIGLSTAYYLALAEQDRKSQSAHAPTQGSIIVVDPSTAICSGASGQNEGVIGTTGFKNEVEALAKLSYDLFAAIASENDGHERFGYSSLKIHAVFSHGYDPSNPKLPLPVVKQVELSDLPKWLKPRSTWQAGLISNGSDAAIVNPRKFCDFLKEECENLGVQLMLNSTATKVHTEPDSLAFSSVDIQTKDDSSTINVPCQNLVISAGSWSDRIFKSLFPSAEFHIPMTERQPAQSWLRRRETDKEKMGTDGKQVWLNPALEGQQDLHLSTSGYGVLFAAGSFADSDPPPPLPADVLPSPEEVEELKRLVSKYTHFGEHSQGLISSGRAYMSRTTNDLPLIMKIPWKELFPSVALSSAPSRGGLFFNFGHYLDGFTLGPGSGKVLTAMIRGKKTSIDTGPFTLFE